MQTIPKEKVRAASEGLRAIAHELRLSVLCHLLNGTMCVAELMKATGASQSNLSQHLLKMRLMGILQNEKRGQQVYYRIANPAFAELVQVLKTIYCPEMCASDIASDISSETAPDIASAIASNISSRATPVGGK